MFNILQSEGLVGFLDHEEKEKIENFGKCWFQYLDLSGNIDLWFCEDFEIKELNHEFRGKNAVTDVLSWENEQDDFPTISDATSNCIGNIAICWSKVVDVAKEEKWSLLTECCRLIVHGICHIIGYDHEISEEEEEKMLEIEINLLKLVGLSDIYPSC